MSQEEMSPQIEVDSVVLNINEAWADVGVDGRVVKEVVVQPRSLGPHLAHVESVEQLVQGFGVVKIPVSVLVQHHLLGHLKTHGLKPI